MSYTVHTYIHTYTEDDLNAIKAEERVGVTATNTFIVLYNGSLNDVNGGSVSTTSPVQASRVIPDTVPPNLMNFILDLNTGTISFTFTETILTSSINVQRATLQSTELGTGSSLPLTTSYPVTENGINIVLNLSAEDLNGIKAIPDLGTSITNTYISYETTFASDAFNNPIVPRLTDDALRAATFIDDMTAPSLSSYTYDLDASTLTLTFSEIVDIDTFDPTLLDFIGPSSSPLTSLPLTSFNVTTVIDSAEVEIIILPPVSFSVQLEPLYTEGIELNANAVVDLSNTVYPNIDQTVYDGQVIPDNTSPLLTNFMLYLSNGTLLLTLNEAVNDTSTELDHAYSECSI